MSASRIIAVFAVHAGTVAEFDLDVTGMSDAQIVAAVHEESGEHIDTTLCHECGHKLAYPQAEELVAITVDDRDINMPLVTP